METMFTWTERALTAAGVALALWCASTLIEARYFGALPPPPASVAARAGTAADVALVPSSPPPAGTWLGRLEAPTVDLSAAVLQGSGDATLARGAGHIEQTALPGQTGNVGIAGHRDTIFRPLRHLHRGDPLVLTTASAVYRYRITSTSIVDPDDVSVLDPTPRPSLTLVTCYPFYFVGHAPRRFIVHADLVATVRRERPETADPFTARHPG